MAKIIGGWRQKRCIAAASRSASAAAMAIICCSVGRQYRSSAAAAAAAAAASWLWRRSMRAASRRYRLCVMAARGDRSGVVSRRRRIEIEGKK